MNKDQADIQNLSIMENGTAATGKIKPPKIAVMIAAFLGESTISQTIDSVLDQSIKSIEIIVCDDGSTDTTPTIVAEYAAADPRIRLVASNRLGAAGARNAAYEASSKPDYLLFLDQDDLLEPNAIVALLDTLAANPDAPACHGLARVIDQQGEPYDMRQVNLANLGFVRHRPGGLGVRQALKPFIDCKDDESTTFDSLLSGCPITSVGQVLIRRDAFERVGRFDDALPTVDDWHLYIKLSRIAPIVRAPEIVLAWRYHDRNTSNDRNAMQNMADRLWRSVLAMDITPKEHAVARTIALHNVAACIYNVTRGDKRAKWNTHIWPAIKLWLKAMG